jgi:hypothetical protein
MRSVSCLLLSVIPADAETRSPRDRPQGADGAERGCVVRWQASRQLGRFRPHPPLPDYARECDSGPSTAIPRAVHHGGALQALLRDQRPMSRVDVLGGVWGAESVRSWRFLSHRGARWRSMRWTVLAGQEPYWLVTRWCPRQDSNLRSRLRRPLLSPLSYGGSRTGARLPAQRAPASRARGPDPRPDQDHLGQVVASTR